MRVPKVVVRQAQRNAKLNMRDGYSASECWGFAMFYMRKNYHRAKLTGVAYGFI